MLAAGGILLTLVGVSIDGLGLHGNQGVGWLQGPALVVGGLMIVVGALLRADVVGLAGTVLFGLAALADVRGSVGEPGIGWRQALVIAVGLTALSIGLIWRRRSAGAGAGRPASASSGSESCNR